MRNTSVAPIRDLITLFIALTAVICAALFTSPTNAGADAWPGINGRVAYSAYDGENYQIYSAKADGTDQVQLTSGNYTSYEPAFSPDGTKIAYGSFANSSLQIWLMNADGSNKQAVTDNTGNNSTVSWHPGGDKLLFVSNEYNDGNGNPDVYTINIDGTDQTRLTTFIYGTERPNFTPDGQHIIFTGQNAPSVDYEVFRMNADGSNITAITNNSVIDYDSALSPDGSKITWSQYDGNDLEIMVSDTDGSNMQQLTSNAGIDTMPSFSADGQKIIYRSSGVGIGDTYWLMDADGNNKQEFVDIQYARISSWQPMILGPIPTTAPSITTNGTSGTLDVPNVFTDPYGAGIDASLVSITSSPSKGTASVDENGIITYTKTTTAHNNWIQTLSTIFIPTAHAQSADDTFELQVCSLSDSSLCSESAVSVTFASNTTSSGSSSNLADTGQSRLFLSFTALSLLMLGTGIAVGRLDRLR